MDDEDIQELYKWIDAVELSRPKRNINRDFSDGVLVAEVIKHFAPRLVDLHNYQPASSQAHKLANWKTLNQKPLKKLNLKIPDNVLQGVIQMKPGVIEVVLNNLRLKLMQYLAPTYHEEEDEEERVQMSPPSPRRDIRPRKPPTRASNYSGARSYGSNAHNSRSTKLPEINPEQHKGHRAGGSVNRKSRNIRRHEPDPYELLADKEQELLASQETIDVMQVKIEKLTQLVLLKDRRIKDLQRALHEG